MRDVFVGKCRGRTPTSNGVNVLVDKNETKTDSTANNIAMQQEGTENAASSVDDESTSKMESGPENNVKTAYFVMNPNLT